MSGVTLVDFLRACLDEDEAAAQAATAGPWAVVPYAYGPNGPYELEVGTVSGGRVVSHQPHEGGGFTHDPDAHHIARHDPARVLADVEAKRRVVERIVALRETLNARGHTMPSKESAELVEGVLLDLAQPYAGHPEWREEWGV